ncbi:N-acylneuraminate cytidylyltransferase [Pseudidiomarina maritima]|uniref:N-acylneuraminate cytidylyltransferase n=1 Tax=Pseudidiomarina maritima TaxID=519453 RepID=A0A1I6GS60_9GAMM|nr:pseudaminic acid cytidylyltransferase [Pseudidiomarina maritima]SFR45044.1 N-acylneuraminate cytidylyltransferase [Pseudidiomarina maritima]
MKIAVIPARGGSKRIPRKNIKEFCGKPMIARSIEAAYESGCFDKVIVSTDDQEIAEVAKDYGAEIPFLRPRELSDDYTGTMPVIAHAIEWFEAQNENVDLACCIYATAPFVSADDIKTGLNVMESESLDFAFTVTSYAFPIQRAIKISSTNRVEMFHPELFNVRSQDLEEAWHDAGQFYWGTSLAWKENKPIFGTSSAPIVLPRHRVQDIDTPEDWTRAELLFKIMNPNGID